MSLQDSPSKDDWNATLLTPTVGNTSTLPAPRGGGVGHLLSANVGRVVSSSRSQRDPFTGGKITQELSTNVTNYPTVGATISGRPPPRGPKVTTILSTSVTHNVTATPSGKVGRVLSSRAVRGTEGVAVVPESVVEQPESEPGLATTWSVLTSFPWPFWAVTIVGFLNEYRGDGFNLIQYQYMVSEFPVSDLQVGGILGVASTTGLVAGFVGSALTDYYGVRNMALIGLPIAVVSRAILTFGRSRNALIAAIVFLKPPGEALMGTAIYMVAIKKLTTSRNRALGFGLQWGIWSSADLVAIAVVERLRTRVFHEFAPIFGQAFSGLRVSVLVTWFVTILLMVFVFLFIYNETAVDLLSTDGEFKTLDEVDLSETTLDPPTWKALSVLKSGTSEGREEAINHLDANFRPKLGGRLWGQTRSPFDAVIIYKGKPVVVTQFDTQRGYVMVNTVHEAKKNEMSFGSAKEFFLMRNFWRAIAMTLCLFGVSKQWGDLYMVMPVFLDRTYGSDVPYYAIQGIHPTMMLFLPTMFVAATATLGNLQVMVPGVFIMGLAPLPMFLAPTVSMTYVWVVWMTMGAMMWAPRLQAWTANLAPEGKEGVFFAVLSIKDVVVGLPSTWANGYLNEVYNPDCPACRDADNNFYCSIAEVGAAACKSPTSECSGGSYADLSLVFDPVTNTSARWDGMPCPTTCFDCPGWESYARTLWGIILATSMISPVMMCLCLPFLMDKKEESKELELDVEQES